MSNNVTEYLSRLLNKKVDAGTEITLSSAQRARLHAWLTNNQVVFDEAILSKKFAVNNLLNGNSNSQVQLNESRQVNSLSSSIAGHVGSVGIDIQRIDELFPNGLPIDPKSGPELTSIFTMSELSYAQSKDNPIETLAGIFAVKEAIQKCADRNKNYLDIQVSYEQSGKAEVYGYAVSISHSGNYAIAVAFSISNDLKNPIESSNSVGIDLHTPSAARLSFKLRSLDLIFFLLIGILFVFGFSK